jgi:hypothetical protein
MISFLTEIVTKIYMAVAMLFKKPDQVMPPTAETEKLVVQQQQDNYFAETMNKSYRQYMYEKYAKENNIKETPYIDWHKLPEMNPNWDSHPSPEELKGYLKKLRMTEEQYIAFRKTLQTDKK